MPQTQADDEDYKRFLRMKQRHEQEKEESEYLSFKRAQDLKDNPPKPKQDLPEFAAQPSEQMIPTKIAAIEVLKMIGTAKIMGYAGVMGPVLSIMAYIFLPMAGLGIAAVFCVFIGFLTFRARNEETRLKQKYSIELGLPIFGFGSK